ncbi:PD-(D/E)XK nuclease-like domain-containing protein [Thorsellia anophelis]|uniref:Exodeoxyribonuclease VIII n=1 Tax=Thorsellia anophelis DSM 18579 TaxID=1123402 RepID=A0A1I0FP95_9GAMM|nr:PD-(D/E)XK nuclease-like domain-containing protein [Thorsellia anophelis]SET60171.1 exodeoxyribonuclease VIII [Thorsellia anophelis DSM 18579]
MKTGIYDNLSNEEYHSSEGISKSQLDLIAVSPSVYLWNKKAPVDTDRLKAFDMGTALHCLLLEPDEFESRFVFAPKVNRMTKAGRQEEAEFIKEHQQAGITIMTDEEYKKLMLMRDSVFAHPVAKKLLEAQGHSERSIYWQDEETGETCRARFDRQIENAPIILDVKKTADINRFMYSVEDYRYHVQDAYYSHGYHEIFGEWPRFVFLAVSETINGGKYPVRVFELEQDWKDAGSMLWRQNLRTLSEAKQNNAWFDIEELTMPYSARRKYE